MKNKQFGIFTQNQLKMIAAVSMVTDHVGAELFPRLVGLRIAGRLAFPIFSFFIYEGCRYTHDRLKYLAHMLSLGLVCVLGYYIYCREIYWNVLITFSLSICILSCMQYAKGQVKKDAGARMRSALLCILCVGSVFALCRHIQVDYGFWGVMSPVFAEIFYDIGCFAFRARKSFRKGVDEEVAKPVQSIAQEKVMPLTGFFFGLAILSGQMGGIQFYSLLSLVLLAAYDGTRGKRKMKYFFYWFYPVHLLIIGALAILIT